MGICSSEDKKSLVSISIYTNKVCYSVGENIQGIIFMQGKPGLTESFLRESTGQLSLVQWEKIRYFDEKRLEPDYEYECELHTLSSKYLDLSSFTREDLMKGIKIPFSIEIPNSQCCPTCYFNKNDHIKHSLKFDFSSFGSLGGRGETQIILKSGESYSFRFGPNFVYIDEEKKHKLMVDEGVFSMLLAVDKNVFTYDEIIPFRVIVDCTKVNLKIKSITISLKREIIIELQKRKDKKEIASKVIKIEKGKEKEKNIIEDSIKFPLDSKYDPLLVYKHAEQMRDPKVIKQYTLAPPCEGKLIVINYYVEAEANFDSLLTTNEKLKKIIGFYVPAKTNISNGQNINPVNKNKVFATNYGLNKKYNNL